MVFDGDCGFCRFWIARWGAATGSNVDYQSYQELGERFPELARRDFEQAVHLVETNGTVTSGAEAVFRALGYSGRHNFVLSLLRKIPGFDRAAAQGYVFIARNRAIFSWLTHLVWGRDPSPQSYFFASWLFLRLIAAIYAISFASLGMQITGLAGARGIVPAAQFLNAVREQTGIDRLWRLPTVCWLGASDEVLVSLCVAGVLISCVALAGALEPLCLFCLWALYLSLAGVSGPFLNFQWDALLLEAGFLAIFLAPLRVWAGSSPAARVSPIPRWLLLWLLFRLMFESGVVKLSSSDPTWRNLTALAFHYETQPLPLWTSWYANQAPMWFQKMSVLSVFVIEFVGAVLIFAPQNLRRLAALALIFLQLLIAGTGNYAFFNLLTIALCVLLLDDAFFARRAPPVPPSRTWPNWVLAPIAVLCLVVTVPQLIGSFRMRLSWPASISALQEAVAPFRSMNGYGLFAVMTTSRPEIVVEGSDDGLVWRAYEFRWKPGDLNKRPRLVAPHQPRLDWQMWFAALGGYQQSPWFLGFVARILEGSPEVLALLASNPFPDAPPRYVRAELYDYHFTRRGDDPRAWWKRSFKGEYCPRASLRRTDEQGN